MRLLLITLHVGALLAATLGAQVVDQSVNLADPSSVVDEDPFGLAMDPDGRHAYVALAGDHDPTWPSTPATAALHNNNRIVKVDYLSGTVVATGTTGLFPEDVALTLDASGQTRHVFVTNSTDGTVTILDAALAPIVTVSLTPCFGNNFGAVYPFGIIASPDSTRVYVGTTGGCGTIDVIDSDPLSGTFSQIVSSFAVPHVSGRMAWTSWPQMVLAAVDFSTMSAGVTVVDVTSPASATFLPAVSDPGPLGFGPGAADVAVRPNGGVLLPVSFLASPRLIEMDPQTGAVLQDLDLGAHISTSTLHGLGLTDDGEYAVVTCLGTQGEVALIHLPTQTAVSTLLNPGLQPNEAVFSPDQSRLLVSFQQAEEVCSYRALPGFRLRADIAPVSPLGQVASLEVDDIEAGQPAVIYASLTGDGPLPGSAGTVFLSQPIFLLAVLTGDWQGNDGFSLTLPNDPILSGVTPWFQAATIDRNGGLRLSNGTQTLFQ